MDESVVPPPFDAETAIRATIWMLASGEGDARQLLTDDVAVETPLGEMHGVAELDAQVNDWREGLSDIDVTVDHLSIDGSSAVVNWHLSGDHTGVILVNEELFFEPTGRHVDLALSTQMEFHGTRICWIRHRYETDALVQQLKPERRS